MFTFWIRFKLSEISELFPILMTADSDHDWGIPSESSVISTLTVVLKSVLTTNSVNLSNSSH